MRVGGSSDAYIWAQNDIESVNLSAGYQNLMGNWMRGLVMVLIGF